MLSWVIYDVDTALRTLIERDGVDGSGVEVVFDAPTKDWASRRNAPTVDVYLYDIREDLRRRERGFRNEYDNGVVIARHLPPRHFKLSYLVTAWTQRAEDEHRLLSALLACFLKCDAIPRELLDGSSLGELGLPVALSVGLPPPEDRSFADVWSALGGELKPSLDLVVTAPTTTGQRTETGPPVTVPPRISIGGGAGWPPREIKVTREKERGLEDASKPAPGDRHGPETGSAVDLGAATPRRSRRAPRRKPGEGP